MRSCTGLSDLIMNKIKSFLADIFHNEKYIPAAFVVTGLLFFCAALGFDYTGLDDEYLILGKNRELRGLDIISLFRSDFFLIGGGVQGLFYRPLALLPWVLAAKAAGPALWLYHLENIVLHTAAAVSFYFLLKKTGASVFNSVFATALFMLQPAGAAIAGFTPNLSYPLLLTLLNLSFISGINYLERREKTALALHILFFIAGMFTLETALGFIPVFLFYAFFVYGESDSENSVRHSGKGSVKAALTACCFYLAVFVIWFAVRRAATGGAMPDRSFSVIWNNFPALFAALQNFFFPFSVKPLSSAAFSAGIIPGVLAAAALLYMPFSGFVRNIKMFNFGVIFFLFFLLPSLLSGYEFNNMPHRVYIPSAGLLIALSEIEWRRLIPARFIPVAAVTVLTVFVCSSLSLLFCYRDVETFWNRVVKDNPHSETAHMQLVTIYHDEARYQEAAKASFDFIQTAPENRIARSWYAVNLGLSGLYEQAEEKFRSFLNATPDDTNLRTAYAEFLVDRERNKEAEREYRKAIENAPENPYVRFSYGNYLLSVRQWQAAEKELRAALDFIMRTPRGTFAALNSYKFLDQWRENLAIVILERVRTEIRSGGRTPADISKDINEAVNLSPSAAVYEKGADMLLAEKDYKGAIKMYSTAMEMEPSRSSAALGAGVASVYSGDLKGAARYFNIALEVDPEHRQAKLYLDEVARRIYAMEAGRDSNKFRTAATRTSETGSSEHK